MRMAAQAILAASTNSSFEIGISHPASGRLAPASAPAVSADRTMSANVCNRLTSAHCKACSRPVEDEHVDRQHWCIMQ